MIFKMFKFVIMFINLFILSLIILFKDLLLRLMEVKSIIKLCM